MEWNGTSSVTVSSFELLILRLPPPQQKKGEVTSN